MTNRFDSVSLPPPLRRFIALLIATFTATLATPAFITSNANADLQPSLTGKYIVGYNDALLKKMIAKKARPQLVTQLQPLIKSPRARQEASKTMGRLKRKLAESMLKGKQSRLDLIGAKVVTARTLAPGVRSTSLDYARASGLLKYLEPDIRISTFATPNDGGFSRLWGLNNPGGFLSTADVDINAPEAWDLFTGDPNLVVAVLDTGVAPVGDLSENLWTNAKEIAGNGVDDDKNGYVDDYNGCNLVTFDPEKGSNCGRLAYNQQSHGTHVAGTIGARGNNNRGVTGVNWQVKIMSLAFLGDEGQGDLSDMIEGVAYAVDMKKRYDRNHATGANIRVINASFGHNEEWSQAEFDTIKELQKAGILLVAAAGNGGPDGIGDNNDTLATYPAGYELDNVISVAAVGRTGSLTYFSNYGAASVDVAAPGSGIISTVFENNYQALDGTSMAAPHVAGIAALVMGYRPNLPYYTVREIIIGSVKDGASVAGLRALDGKMLSPGIVDARAALELAQGDLQTPHVVRSPAARSVNEGKSTTFTVVAAGGAPLTYQWYKDGAAIGGAVAANYTIASAKIADEGSYACIVGNSHGRASSDGAKLTVVRGIDASPDANGDGKIDFQDIMAVMQNYNKRGVGLKGDVNKDGGVDYLDLALVFRALQDSYGLIAPGT